MNTIDELILMAYIDGELDSAGNAEMEQRIAVEPDLRERVEQLRAVNATLRVAFNDALYTESLEIPAINQKLATNRRFEFNWHDWFRPLALAASVVGVFALGAGSMQLASVWFESSDPAVPVRAIVEQSQDHSLFQEVLETQPSGAVTAWPAQDTLNRQSIQPVRTYKTQEGVFCREFMLMLDHGPQRGVACRELDGRWNIRVMYVDI